MKHIRSIAALLLAGTLFPALSGTELKIDGIPLVRQDFASQEDMISAVYEEILVRFFISAGIPPNENDTFAFLKKLNSLLPAGLPGKSEAELQLLAKQRLNQLSPWVKFFLLLLLFLLFLLNLPFRHFPGGCFELAGF